jgi:lipopolysaccharide transport system permease protein
MKNAFKLAFGDMFDGFSSWRIWLLLGWQDIVLRYRRSQLGPFWLTLSMAITIYSMGFLYGHLFKMDLHEYFPLLSTGLLIWTMMASMINESTNAFIESAGYLKQIKLSYFIFVLRIITRNTIIFAHNIIAIIPVLFYCHVPIDKSFLLLFPGLILLIINGTFYGVILAILGARFRDIAQVISSLIQVIFFVTPVIWAPKFLPAKYLFLVKFNPFAQFLDLIRMPLIGAGAPDLSTYVIVLAFTFFGFFIMLYLFTRVRHRIIYWL